MLHFDAASPVSFITNNSGSLIFYEDFGMADDFDGSSTSQASYEQGVREQGLTSYIGSNLEQEQQPFYGDVTGLWATQVRLYSTDDGVAGDIDTLSGLGAFGSDAFANANALLPAPSLPVRAPCMAVASTTARIDTTPAWSNDADRFGMPTQGHTWEQGAAAPDDYTTNFGQYDSAALSSPPCSVNPPSIVEQLLMMPNPWESAQPLGCIDPRQLELGAHSQIEHEPYVGQQSLDSPSPPCSPASTPSLTYHNSPPSTASTPLPSTPSEAAAPLFVEGSHDKTTHIRGSSAASVRISGRRNAKGASLSAARKGKATRAPTSAAHGSAAQNSRSVVPTVEKVEEETMVEEDIAVTMDWRMPQHNRKRKAVEAGGEDTGEKVSKKSKTEERVEEQMPRVFAVAGPTLGISAQETDKALVGNKSIFQDASREGEAPADNFAREALPMSQQGPSALQPTTGPKPRTKRTGKGGKVQGGRVEKTTGRKRKASVGKNLEDLIGQKWVCWDCRCAFTRGSDLTRHFARTEAHTAEKKEPCLGCDKLLGVRKSSQARHMENNHPELMEQWKAMWLSRPRQY
ncbi:hypothetical protein BV25DRAFT_1903746 [Artomyces pyxidatus]|uniref:Uncharacterized protein n=1 Tax=Artomyces pyxidatus TaxID=48021 RepID=A0ACB8SHC7_9AGAM|nr:hypothetical protein BV25DRAFT_1903746 [Artomyces pyxidatus]